MSRPSPKVEAAAQAIFAIDSRPLGRPGTPWRQLLPSARAAYRAMATAALAAAARVEEESSKGDDAGPSSHASNGQPTSAFASPPHEDGGGQQSVASDGRGDDAVPPSPALERKGDAVGI
jgi:hypothetical protein